LLILRGSKAGRRSQQNSIVVLVGGAGAKPFFVLPGTMRPKGLDRQPIQGTILSTDVFVGRS